MVGVDSKRDDACLGNNVEHQNLNLNTNMLSKECHNFPIGTEGRNYESETSIG